MAIEVDATEPDVAVECEEQLCLPADFQTNAWGKTPIAGSGGIIAASTHREIGTDIGF